VVLILKDLDLKVLIKISIKVDGQTHVNLTFNS